LFGGYEEESEGRYKNSSIQPDVIYVNVEKVWLDDEAKEFLRQYDYYLAGAKEGIAEAQFEVGKCRSLYHRS
jgi:hypothetical protein